MPPHSGSSQWQFQTAMPVLGPCIRLVAFLTCRPVSRQCPLFWYQPSQGHLFIGLWQSTAGHKCHRPLIDSFTVSLHKTNGRLRTALTAGKLPLGVCKRIVSYVWKTVEIPTSHVIPQFIASGAFPNLYLNQPIKKGWCQLMGNHVAYPTDRRVATRLGLCNSLCWAAHWLESSPYRQLYQLGVQLVWLALFQ